MMHLRRLLPRMLSIATLLICLGTTALAQMGPAITITPDTLDFLQVKGNKFAELTFTITNSGGDTLEGSVASPGGVFQIMQGGGDFSLTAGDSVVVLMRFTPSAAQVFDDSIAITHNVEGQASPAYVYVTGMGLPADPLEITPDTLAFGNVPVGTTVEGSFTIHNTTNLQLAGTLGSIGSGFTIVGDGSYSIAAGDSQQVTVRFTPSAAVTYRDSIAIVNPLDTLLGPIYAYVTGTGVSASVDTVRLSASANPVVFGPVTVGASASRTVYITNESDSTVVIGSVLSTDGAFSVQAGSGIFSLQAGEMRAITVSFAPTVEGAANGTLSVAYVGTNGLDTLDIGLVGLGLPAATPQVSVAVQPELVLFGNVAVGENGERTVTVINTSTSATVGGTIGAPTSGAFTVVNGSGSFQLAPGQMQTFTVRFSPTAQGLVRDSLTINYDAASGLSASTVQLIGAGIEAQTGGGVTIGVQPSSVDFGSIAVGATAQQTFTLTNPSTTLALTGSLVNPAAPFYINGSAGAFTLAPGATQTFTVQFTPTVAGSFSDNVLVGYAAGDSSGVIAVRLTGTATAVVSGIADEATRSAGAITSFPEPTIASTTLRYATTATDNVRLSVFDANGREVARLVDGVTEAGEHTVAWDADGQPAGVYLVQLRTSTGVSTGRVTIVR